MNSRTNSTSGTASELHSDLPVPPGLYLAEVLRELGMERSVLATQLNLSLVEVDALLAGNTPLTQALAGRLEKATRVRSNIWLGLEAEYQEATRNAIRNRECED